MAISGGQQRLDWLIIPGVPCTLALYTHDGSDWSSAPRVLVGPLVTAGDGAGTVDLVIPEITATIDGTDGSLARATIGDHDMATILAAHPLTSRTALPWHVRLGTGESETAISTGYLVWDLTGRQSTTATLVVGGRGQAGESAYAAAVAGGFTGTAEEWAAGLAADRMAAVAAADRAEAAENRARGLVTSAVRAIYDPTADDEILTLSIPTGMLDPLDSLILLLPVEV